MMYVLAPLADFSSSVRQVINVSGHRMGTAEVESSLVAHEAVAEAAVVGFPHQVPHQQLRWSM